MPHNAISAGRLTLVFRSNGQDEGVVLNGDYQKALAGQFRGDDATSHCETDATEDQLIEIESIFKKK
jgi:hypothetical protein